MSRKPAFLAALASSAVPGLDPVSVQAARTEPGHRYEVAFLTDSQQRRWVVRAPLTAAAGAQMDTTVALLGLIGRRLPFSVPSPRGFVAVPEGRAVVYPRLSGRPIDFESLPAGPGLAAEVGRAIAALHNIDRAVFDEAGLPVYDSEEYRTRKLADLDRGAATGHVPTALLSRWERALEDVSIWRFAPTPIHGDLTGDQVLVAFDDDDAATGKVRGLTGWDDAKVADPAEDFAGLITECSPEAFETVLEAYAHSRVERPDRHLRRRAKLAAELRLLARLLTAVSAGERDLITTYAADLRDLDERTIDEPDAEPEAMTPHQAAAAAAASEARAKRESDAVAEDDPEDTGELGGDMTQPMNAGRFSEPTTVIPEDELDKLRRTRIAPGDDEDGADGDLPPAGASAEGTARIDEVTPAPVLDPEPVAVTPVAPEPAVAEPERAAEPAVAEPERAAEPAVAEPEPAAGPGTDGTPEPERSTESDTRPIAKRSPTPVDAPAEPRHDPLEPPDQFR